MNIVLINLTRFGDQLQSQAAINALAGLKDSTNEPANRICLITLSNFASSTVFLNNVSLTYPLPKDAFMESLDNSWASATAQMWNWRQELYKQFKPDLICNMTPSVSARLLGRFLAQDMPVTGYGLDAFGFGTATPWAAFLQGSSRRREVSPFNLVDLFRAVAGKSRGDSDDSRLLAPGQDSAAASYINEILAATPEAAGFIAFQLGASEKRRRWPTEYFAELGNTLWRETRHIPLLLGGKDEETLASVYADAAEKLDPSTPHISLIGRTNLQELAAALTRSALLVSNDTGTMHLAAGLGRPVLGIFLATAQPWDTGPYLTGACSLEPDLPCHPCTFGKICSYDEKCRHYIRPLELSKLCLSFLQTGEWAQLGPENEKRPRTWLAVKDQFGFLDLSSLSGHEGESRTIWFREQRNFLRQFLDRDTSCSFNYLEPTNKFNFPEPEREKLAGELQIIAGQLALLVELGEMLLAQPLPMLQERFISALHKVSSAFENSSYLLPLGLLWQIEVQEKGDELATALNCMKQYKNLISSLLQRVTEI